MRVKIYQINPERDNNRMKFMSLSDSQSPDPSIYDEVFDAEIDENELEEIYGRFNMVLFCVLYYGRCKIFIASYKTIKNPLLLTVL